MIKAKEFFFLFFGGGWGGGGGVGGGGGGGGEWKWVLLLCFLLVYSAYFFVVSFLVYLLICPHIAFNPFISIYAQTLLTLKITVEVSKNVKPQCQPISQKSSRFYCVIGFTHTSECQAQLNASAVGA